ncbi:MAG: hypothetical protein II231_06615 [Rikenellaceae bacterium]|nr:hypothetical protein [Rikenellaceae bacterium]
MGTKIFGIVATAAIVVVIALTLINFGNYHSLLPERLAAVEEVAEVVEIDTVAIDTLAGEVAVSDVADSLALVTPTDTLRTEQ